MDDVRRERITRITLFFSLLAVLMLWVLATSFSLVIALLWAFMGITTLYAHDLYSTSNNYAFLSMWVICPAISTLLTYVVCGDVLRSLVVCVAALGVLMTFVVKRSLRGWIAVTMLPLVALCLTAHPLS